ncbi:unnamed protein product, partial [Prorocentrum cordatum]
GALGAPGAAESPAGARAHQRLIGRLPSGPCRAGRLQHGAGPRAPAHPAPRRRWAASSPRLTLLVAPHIALGCGVLVKARGRRSGQGLLVRAPARCTRKALQAVEQGEVATASPAEEAQPEDTADVNVDGFDEVASELTASDIALQIAVKAWGDVSPDFLPKQFNTLHPPWMEAATARDANMSEELPDDQDERPSSEGLPIHEHREDIKVAMQSQRVTVLVGGTGCGKSTQMPQYILEDCAARGEVANVMVTQPRRMAAVTLARRVARERGEKTGTEVGWRIRGDTNPGRQLSFATAGYLLSWFTVDPSVFGDLTHIVLDEAHERTADMELLILLVRLLMRFYPGPRLVLMSATIDTSLFVEYFQEFAQPAGVPLRPLTVDGRLFPVETLHLEDLAEGRAPRGGRLPEDVQRLAARSVPKVFQGARVARDNIKPRVWRELEELAVALVPAVAEAGSTMLVFIWKGPKRHEDAPGAWARSSRVGAGPPALHPLSGALWTRCLGVWISRQPK